MDRHAGSIITANNFPLLLLGHPANARPALFRHLREVLQARDVHRRILSFHLRSLLARRVGGVDIALALDLLLVAAVGIHAHGQREET